MTHGVPARVSDRNEIALGLRASVLDSYDAESSEQGIATRRALSSVRRHEALLKSHNLPKGKQDILKFRMTGFALLCDALVVRFLHILTCCRHPKR